ncbi:MAG TPA: molybdopterin-dependent oxidoreductase, partial [Candidatus Dormibacteraeota bacterium]|nr:molybdopterin-dependent oxidoreductase [Candidatus Dormibacteraeota bacterium]
PTAGIPSSARFVAAWDHLPREGYDKAVVLPAATFAERQGSYTNLEGTVQFLRPPIALRPPLIEGWQVLVELAAALGVTMDYVGIGHIQREMALQPPDPNPAPTPVLVGPAHP